MFDSELRRTPAARLCVTADPAAVLSRRAGVCSSIRDCVSVGFLVELLVGFFDVSVCILTFKYI